jgi:hypothetical protein
MGDTILTFHITTRSCHDVTASEVNIVIWRTAIGHGVPAAKEHPSIRRVHFNSHSFPCSLVPYEQLRSFFTNKTIAHHLVLQ